MAQAEPLIRGYHAHNYFDPDELGTAQAFAESTPWAVQERSDLTIAAHGLSGNDLADHTRCIVWFGSSEPLDLTIFG